ncbi:unnamed protein product [Blepharisma stoltei]|uniref:Uncharacterized protein n=1 Tax=Blepharisma stoltei TaxID=1481888 RepID=A0AAU9IVP2_9CILI|nr:unnamed protein product [Blepharisma stoltei]
MEPHRIPEDTNKINYHEEFLKAKASAEIFEDDLNNIPPSRLVDSDSKFNLCLGSIIGAFIGDALGAAIEFNNSITDELLSQTLEMQGGGCLHLGPGQVTDDSELAMCLLQGLCDGKGILNLDYIARFYRLWILSHPPDKGNTVLAAFSSFYDRSPRARYCIENAEKYNKSSESNGSFMRCTPLAVFCRNLNDDEIREAVKAECSMTHSNKTIQDAEVCYVKAITSLINSHGNREKAYNDAKNIATLPDVQQWLEDIERSEPMPGNPNIGWAKIAFDHAFRHMKNGSSFYTAVSETLRIGGDTDTNACIVGGLIGAAEGYNALPQEWKNKVQGYDFLTLNRGIERPWFLDQTVVESQAETLYRIAPRSLSIVGLAKNIS